MLLTSHSGSISKVEGENAFHESQLARLEADLDRAFAESKLPQTCDRRAVSELLALETERR